MKYYRAIFKDDVRFPLVTDKADLYEIQEMWDKTQLPTENGKEIHNWNQEITLYSCQDGEPQDVLGSHIPWHAFSPRLIETLMSAKISGIQYLPVRIKKMDGSEIGGYRVANILNMVCNAFDRDKSVYETFGEERPDKKGQIKCVMSYVLHEEQLSQYDILRLEEFRYNVIVSEKVRDIFKKGKFTGWDFYQAEVH